MSHVAGMLSYQEAKCLPTKAVNASVSEYQTFHLDMHTQYSNQYISISRNKFIYGVRMCLDGKGREDKSFLWRHRDCDVLYASEATICIISLSSLVCMVGVIFVYVVMVYWFYGYSFFMLNWIFQHDYLDTYCFECLICMCFVFAPVQRNWACFTWKGALEICLLLLLLPLFHCCLQIKTIWSNTALEYKVVLPQTGYTMTEIHTCTAVRPVCAVPSTAVFAILPALPFLDRSITTMGKTGSKRSRSSTRNTSLNQQSFNMITIVW